MSMTTPDARPTDWGTPDTPAEPVTLRPAPEAGSGPAPEPTARQRATVLCDLGRWADAATAAGEAVAAEPRNADVWCLTSRAHMGLGRPDAALRAARTASALDDGAEEPHRLASLALGELGRDDEAADAAVQATRCAPHSWEAHALLARCLAVFRDRLPEARQAAERARELGPSESGPHLAVGAVELAAGRRQDATSAFCAALGVDPQCFEAHSQLALLSAASPGRRPVLPRIAGVLRRRAAER